MRKINQIILSRENGGGVEHSFLNLSFLLIAVISLLANITNNILDIHQVVIISCYVLAVLNFGLFFISRKTSRYLLMQALFVGMFFVYLSVLYFYNNGINGCSTPLSFIILAYIVFIARGLRRNVYTAIWILFFLCLFLIEYFNPDLVVHYVNRTTHFADVFVGYAITFGFLIVLVRFAKKQFEEERGRAEKEKAEKTRLSSSINSAKGVQERLLSDKNTLKNIFNESFLFFMPKDLLSGDFFFTTQIDNKKILAVGDCTGHGPQGALLSALGISFIKDIVDNSQISDPSEILRELNIKFNSALGHFNQGMDIAIITLTDEKHLEFASAKRPLLLFRKGEMLYQKVSDGSISGQSKPGATFKKYTFELEKGDLFYLFSDGFPDQFGGETGDKYLISNFRNFIADGIHLNIKEQHKRLVEEYYRIRVPLSEEGSFKYRQTDDIIIVGARI